MVAGLCYVVLAIRQRRSCWIAGLLSTLAYGVLCQAAGLWLQGALQVVYALLAVLGWWQWRQQPLVAAAANAVAAQREPTEPGIPGARQAAANAPLAVQRLPWWGTVSLADDSPPC